MSKILCALTAVIILVLSLASCAPANIESPSTTNTTPAPTVSLNVNSIADGNSAFALDLYRQLKTQDGNLFLSPYSISAALAMTAAGAKENTLEQMLSSLHYSATGEGLHKLLSQLDTILKSRSQDVKIQTSDGGELKEETIDGFTLNIINALWGQKDYHFQKEYLNLVEKYYGGELNDVDFMNEPEKALQMINDWADEQTKGRIKDLLSSGDIDSLTRLILTNAIYFKAQWQHPFMENATAPAPFNLLDNNTVTVPFMHEQEQFSYADSDNYQAVGLPYVGGDLDMVVLLPKEGKFQEFEESLDIAALRLILAKMERKAVKVSLPKFSFMSEFKLKQTLTALGMTDAFDDKLADFSGITGDKSLYIDEVIHKSFVGVDEKGTEAAAVTAVIMAGVSMPNEIKEFNADRPFMFLIRDIKTGSILFMGKVMNPAV